MIPEVQMAEEVWQEAARTWNQDITSSTTQRKQDVNKKWGEAINLKAHP